MERPESSALDCIQSAQASGRWRRDALEEKKKIANLQRNLSYSKKCYKEEESDTGWARFHFFFGQMREGHSSAGKKAERAESTGLTSAGSGHKTVHSQMLSHFLASL